jgi:ubiquinone/menaquinone biosynthesis C-methylase UbiE
MKKKFDYNQRIWGTGKASLSPTNWGALNLKYCLEALEGVKGKVLEVGCGGGVFSRGIKPYRSDLELIGLDISQKSIEYAQSVTKEVAFLLGDVYHMPFKAKSFESVVCFDLLEHLDHPYKALREIKRVLKPGGIFYSVTPLEGSLFTLHGWLWKLFRLKLKEKQIGHVQRFTLREVLGLFDQAGFKTIRYRYTRHFFIELIEIVYRFWRYFSKTDENDPFSVEEQLKVSQPSFIKKIITFFYNSVIFISFLESRLLANFPGHTVNIMARKET